MRRHIRWRPVLACRSAADSSAVAAVCSASNHSTMAPKTLHTAPGSMRSTGRSHEPPAPISRGAYTFRAAFDEGLTPSQAIIEAIEYLLAR